MLKTNYHMHTVLCGHASGSILDNLNMAIKLGYKEIGFSEHAPLPLHEFNDVDSKRLYAYENMSISTFNHDYLDVLNKLKKENNISIKIGLESEYIEGNDEFYKSLRNKLDYMILGVHFFKHNGKLIDTYSEITYENIDAYVNNIENAFKSGLFDYLAHPDIFLYNDIKFNDVCKNAARRIAELCIKYDIYLEINCNGKGKYPRYEFYEAIKDMPLKFIIGVDSHDPLRLSGSHIEESIALANKLGLKVYEYLEVQR